MAVKKWSLLVLGSFWLLAGQAQDRVAEPSPAIDPVVQAIRKSVGGSSQLSMCAALQWVKKKPQSKDELKKRNDAIRIINQKTKNKDANMLRARGDVFRKGLYGFKQDSAQAFKLYRQANSADAGFNAALMLHQQYDLASKQHPQVAKQILAILNKSGASKKNSKGLTGSQAHYIAGWIHEEGYAGQANLRLAFEHYMASARNSYVPGVYRYLRLVAQSLPYLSESERAAALPEVRLMISRWRYHSRDIMELTGDLYAGRWLPDDDDGFFAQYYWRIAQLMAHTGEKENTEVVFTGKIKKLSKEKEERLISAVQAAKRNIVTADHRMEFIDLCAE